MRRIENYSKSEINATNCKPSRHDTYLSFADTWWTLTLIQLPKVNYVCNFLSEYTSYNVHWLYQQGARNQTSHLFISYYTGMNGIQWTNLYGVSNWSKVSFCRYCTDELHLPMLPLTNLFLYHKRIPIFKRTHAIWLSRVPTALLSDNNCYGS